MKNTIIALLLLILATGATYHFMMVGELQSEVRVQKQLYKACTAQLMWVESKLEE